MQGPVLTMPSMFDTNSFFSRSHSSPNIPDLAKLESKPALKKENAEIPRSASYTFIPGQLGQYPLEDGSQATTAPVSDGKSDTSPTADGREGRKPNKLTKEERPRLESVGRRKSLVSRPKSWIQKVKGSPERQDGQQSLDASPVEVPPVPSISKSAREDRRKSMSESFATFARKSWMTSSRSPSPSRTPSTSRSRKASVDSRTSKAEVPKLEPQPTANTSASPPKPDTKRQSTLQKIKQRPASVLMTFTNLASANSSTSSLPSSMENRSASTPRTSIDKVPPVPKGFSTEKLLMGLDGHRRKDELWSAFRSLDNDFSKFQSKSWSLKTNIVRSSLLPFLKNHASHPSTKNLRPEDIEKRVTVLNKWWNGILEVLDGRQNQAVSGVDRPILLEACYCIMIRPEWRATAPTFVPLSKRSSRSPTRQSLSTKKSSASIQSTASQFVSESIYHNIRNLFVQNLLAQVTYVVEKMSLRHAPASLVTFCGKAVAYAFFFVPGVAEVLVRVWNLSLDTLSRIAEEHGLSKRPNNAETAEALAFFPDHLKSLGWSSPKSMVASLRKNATLSIMAGKVNWFGPWSARWCGRDSDLFFVFAKHYFILAEELLGSSDLPMRVKCRAPAFILVQAQLMTALDGTIHRQTPAEPLPITFDDVLTGADANAAALPVPSNNFARPMAENRLIMLLRDFLSEHSSDYGNARRAFAEVFSKTLQASAKKTSLFDHSACFVLCDFIEEAMQIFVRFQHTNPLEDDHIDWAFWLQVCQKMLESQNTMSEIRLFAFVYSSWAMIMADQSRREVICMDWLLAEETFMKFFCHWCPMVRAYYMRLLCWRLCRDDGDASDFDTKIFSTVSIRLKKVYAHYLFIKQGADRARILPPSTAPCHPAPGRRLLIIRNDYQAPAANIFLSFDGIVPPNNLPSATPSTPFKRHSLLPSESNPDSATPKLTTDPSPAKDSKKRWSLLGKSIPSFETQSSDFSSSTVSSSPPKDIDEVRRETANARMTRPQPQRASSSGGSTEKPAYRAYCFKFSLEWAQSFDRNVKRGNPERRIVSPRLPNPAQACIGARVPGTGMEILPLDPGKDAEGVKYSGRALAEWALIVGECNSFVERRRAEGVPSLKLVEVPVLGVEGFRKFGG